jgi:D-aminopeptidase
MPDAVAPAVIAASKIDAIFAAYDTSHAPGVAVGIAIAGRPVYRKAFGLANAEMQQILTPGMRMRIGSTTKHFAALAYMLLVEEGLASLEDPVRKHIPEMSPAVADGVTMRQLMSHTSGLRCSLDLSMQLNGIGHFMSHPDTLNLFTAQDAINFQPETSWSYNNGGYTVLTVAIERITGQPLEDVLRERIFTPLGMNDTLLRRLDTDFVPNSATLHMLGEDGSFTKEYMGMEVAGEGGMASTVDDMLRWMAHMDRPVVGTPETWAAIRSPYILKNGYSTRYGLGVSLGRYRGQTTIEHGGTVMGGGCQMIKAVEAGLDIIVITNRAGVDTMSLADRIIDACVPDLGPPLEDVPGVNISGLYYAEATGSTLHLLEHEGRQLIGMGGATIPARRDAGGRLHSSYRIFDAVVEAPPGESAPSELTYRQWGNAEVLRRLEPGQTPDLAGLAGLYSSASTGTSGSLVVDGDDVFLTFKGRWNGVRYRLDYMGGPLWRAVSMDMAHFGLGGFVEFDPDGSGFAFSAGRTRRLRFERGGLTPASGTPAEGAAGDGQAPPRSGAYVAGRTSARVETDAEATKLALTVERRVFDFGAGWRRMKLRLEPLGERTWKAVVQGGRRDGRAEGVVEVDVGGRGFAFVPRSGRRLRFELAGV